MGEGDRMPLLLVRLGQADPMDAEAFEAAEAFDHSVREVKRSEAAPAAVDPRMSSRTAADIKRNNDATTLAMRLLKRSMPRLLNLEAGGQ